MRSSIQSPKRRLATALSAFPTCSVPVGLGAKRTRVTESRVNADTYEHTVGRSLISLCAVVGTVVGGFVPALWGNNGIGLAGVLFAAIGGIAGVWLGLRLSD
jgi:hypothetical protein